MNIQILIIVALLPLSACSMSPVQPWQRDVLARPQMQLTHAVDDAYDDHIYFSKEASSGGKSFAGGGCGCN
jgi:hypothetical protein